MRVMSFNIRYPEPSDGPHIWENRRNFVADLINHYAPDIAGLQEPVIEQLQFLDDALPHYARFGVSRYGNDEEKFTAVYYRRDTIELIENAAFWFSQTPDIPGSSSWLIHKPYAVNWAQLRHIPTGVPFAFFNTHFPYKPSQAEARFQAAKLLSQRAAAAAENVILTGDFNSKAGFEIHRTLLEQFRDARIEAAHVLGPQGTVHGFSGDSLDRRVDWILFRGPLTVRSFHTITDQRDGLYPSDHFPVLAEVDFDNSAQALPLTAHEDPAGPQP